jgi:hypothetical protein
LRQQRAFADEEQMCGWFKLEMAWASRRKRASRS